MTNRHAYLIFQACFSLIISAIAGETGPPNDFPRFQVPGHEQEMATVRAIFWLHYPAAGPKATLWDEWQQHG